MKTRLIFLSLALIIGLNTKAMDYYDVGGTDTCTIVVSAGPDRETCGTSPVTLAADAIPGAHWTGGAGTFAPNRNAANAIYTPAVSEIGTSTALTWNFPDPDSTGPCTAATDRMIIFSRNPTVANAGADQTTCGTSSITLAANKVFGATWTGGAGTFAPNRDSANAIYTPAISEIGTTITLTWNVPGVSPCTGATDQMNITIATVANAGADRTTCGGSSINLAANTITGANWTGGSGTFTPNRNAAFAVYTPAASEIDTTITLTWNAPDPDGIGPCTATTDQMNITFINANAGVDQITCGASPITLAANAITGANWTGGAGTFIPNRNTANATYTPALSEIGTTITLTWNVPDPDGTGPCTAATDQMNIHSNNVPVANAGADQTTCGTSSIVLGANIILGANWTGGAGTFFPNRGTSQATYTPAISEIGTTITLTWNTPDLDGPGPCTATTDTMTITVNVPVASNAGADQTVCGIVPVALNANVVAGGNWTGGAGTFNPSRNTANATYTPAISENGTTITLQWNVPDPDGAGPCSFTADQMNITVNTAVIANAGTDQTTCGTTFVILAANPVSAFGWTGGAGTFNPNRNAANAIYTPAVSEIGTTITLTWNVLDPDGTGPCTAATDAMNIVITAPITPTFTQIGPLCQNSTAPALPATSNNGISGTWSPATINTSIAGTTTYTFTPAAGQCATPVTMDIVIELCCTATVSAGPDVSSYFGVIDEQCVSKTAVVQNGTAPFTYMWTLDRSLLPGESITNANTATVTVCLLDTSSLCITVTDANGCVFTDCATIFAQDVRCFVGNSGDHKIYVCHNNNTICVDQSTLASHLNHGDYYGQCISNTLNIGETASGEIAGTWLKIYPNPGHGNFTLFINSAGSDINYVDAQIINMSGQIIKKVKINGQSKIDFAIKNAGVYFIRVISTDKKIVTRKVVVLE